MRSFRRWGVVVSLLVASACGRGVAPPLRACGEVLESRLPAARVTNGAAGSALDAALDYEVREAWWRWRDPVRGRLECTFEPGPHGALRLAAATLDGVELSRTEMTIVNADLLLADMRRAGGGD
jgi:hypothetical protein